jgi:hypothetical protein
MTENEMGRIIVDCAVRLHKELGPGLLDVLPQTELDIPKLRVRE